MTNQPLDLASLVARLRSAGLRTDIRQYLAAHELLLALAGRGHDLTADSEALASHLGPVFCGSPEEQQLFRQEFMAWRGEPRAASAPVAPPVKKKDWRGAWVLVVCAAIALSGTVGILIVTDDGKQQTASLPPPPDPVPIPEAPDAAAVESAFVVGPPTMVSAGDVPVEDGKREAVPWPAIIVGAFGAGLLAFLLLWLRQKKRRDHCLSRMAPDPNTRRIELNPPPPTITQIRTIALRRISAGLRRTRANEVFDLSVAATVNATANAGGFVVPVFAPRVAIPEYLVLIDRRSESDHSAQLVYGWVTQLCNQGVAADCYEFDSDPRVCREFGTQRSHRLPAMLACHHRATVLLFADGDVCIDPLTNRPQEWLRWFNSLPNRVCLTMSPPYRWSANEQRLSEAGFVVVPASPIGLQIAAAMDRNSLAALSTGAKYAREFPRLLAQDTLRWLDRNPPPDATVTRLLRALHDFLGPDGYAWLCACAIYPQISWPITLTLLDTLLPPGSEIAARKAIDEQLPSIARLPWFRYGYMPDWLRKLLIAQLEPEKEALVRSTLEKLVCGLLSSQDAGDPRKGEADGSKLGIRIRPKALDVAKAAPPDSPLQDEVFLDFLAGATPDPLSLRLSSLPQIGEPRRRSFATRTWERWRALGVRRPLLLRSLISLLVALPVGIALWAMLSRVLKPAPVPVPDSDVTYFLTSSDLSSTEAMVAVAPNGQFMLLASPKVGPSVEIWALEKPEMLNRVAMAAQPQAVAISPNSDRMAILDTSGDLYLVTPSGENTRNSIGAKLPFPPGRAEAPYTLRFNADSTLLLLYSQGGMAVLDTGSLEVLATRVDKVDAATFDSRSPAMIMAFIGRRLVSLNARSLTDPQIMGSPFPVDLLEFSFDGKHIASATLLSQSNSYEVELVDAYVEQARAKMTLDPGLRPSGWVWSGDGNLVAYEEARGRTAIYDISSGQLVTTGESRIPATNRLYTIRFVRSAQRLLNNTYYQISERSIDLAPAELPAEQPMQGEPRQQTLPPSPSAADNAQTEKLMKQVLGSLEPDVRALAQRLVNVAAGQGIIVRLTDGRVKDVLHGALRPDSLALHEAGRAFDFAVWSDNGKFMANDMNRMSMVGKIGKGIGLTWGGDVNASGYMHFELPKGGNATQQPTAEVDKENEAVIGSLDRETGVRARQLLDMARKEGMTLSLRSARQLTRLPLRHRSDVSAKLDAEGRAFNVAVLMPDGTWSGTDFSMLARVSRIAYGLGFDWSGDWGYEQYYHFELPHAAAKEDSAAASQTTVDPATDSLRLAQSEFNYPGPGEAGLRTVYSGIVYSTEKQPVGRFELRIDPPSPKEPRLVARVALGLYAGRNVNARSSTALPTAADGGISMTAEEFAKDGMATKTASVGGLQYSLVLEGARIPEYAEQPSLDRESLRIRIEVRPVANPGRQDRPRATAD